jgi:hypothetical protein
MIRGGSFVPNRERIVLITGDSDFVPAAKLARREGLDVVLDPLWNHIAHSLHEHIDGLTCFWVKRDGRPRHEISVRVRPRYKAVKNQARPRRDRVNRSSERPEAQST